MTTTYSLEPTPSSINVSSGEVALRYIRRLGLEPLALGVDGPAATLGLQGRFRLAAGAIEVQSGSATLSNPFLVGIASAVAVTPSAAELRLLPTGSLPSTAPTTRSFQPPSYRIEKTTAMNGRTVRQIMCSKPSDALLSLEYINTSDAYAEEVLAAYDRSYGSRYGFSLAPEILSGAGDDLLSYINLAGSSLKWHYDGPPSVESVIKGVCNLRVQLRGKIAPTGGSSPISSGANSISAIVGRISIAGQSMDTAISCNTPNGSLLLHFDGVNGGSTFSDSGPLGIPVEAIGTVVTSTAQSRFSGSAGYFDGGGYLSASSCGLSLDSGPFTVEVWLRPDELPPEEGARDEGVYNCAAISSPFGIGGGLRIVKLPSGFTVRWISATGANVGTSFDAAYSYGEWYHVAAVDTGTDFAIYVNGALAAATNMSLATSAGNTYFVGAINVEGSPLLFYTGYMDELRAKAGEAVYTSNFTPPTAPFTS